MANQGIAQMAHPIRRAETGAPYDELEARARNGYRATVEGLLHPEAQPDFESDLLERYFLEWKCLNGLEHNQPYWLYRMVNAQRPLEEKICLFWHGIFCVGNAKCDHGWQIQHQLDKFRRYGLDPVPGLLVQLAGDPAMIFYLDNCLSHNNAINENWGRELLELFSMGVGMDGHANYTEEDVKVCARAFTGWTIGNAIPRYPYGKYEAHFLYNPTDHDDSEKTFLGETGRFNGEDVIDIICKQPATAKFISRHLYNYFVADEPQVPTWQNAAPRDPEAIKMLEEEYFRSHYDIRSMLRLLFNSDFFKKARFAKVKSPAEVVVGALRLVGDFADLKPGLTPLAMEVRYMGQDLMNPPTVEGWHTGTEWIDTGTLVERINFTATQMGNVNLPGVRAIIDRLASESTVASPERLVDGCLDMLGCYQLPARVREQLIEHSWKAGQTRGSAQDFPQVVSQMLQLIVATQEYQFA